MKYYVQSEYKYLVWLLAVLLFAMGILMLIVEGYEGFILLGASVLFFGLGFIFNMNSVTLTDEAILLNFVRLKKRIELKSITNIRIYKGRSPYSVNQVIITTDHIPEIGADVSMGQFIQYCNQAHIPIYMIGYQKRMIQAINSKVLPMDKL